MAFSYFLSGGENIRIQLSFLIKLFIAYLALEVLTNCSQFGDGLAFLEVMIPGNKDLHLRVCSFQQGKNKMKTLMKK